MKIALSNPLPETLTLRNMKRGDQFLVKHISTSLVGSNKFDRRVGYLVYDCDGKLITLYKEEITIISRTQ